MLLDFNKSEESFRTDVEALKVLLEDFSQLSLFEPQDKRDKFLNDCHLLVNGLCKDSISGGCYQIEKNEVKLSLSYNLLLADFLQAASQTFFDGELNYAANQIFTSLFQFLTQAGSNLLVDEMSFLKVEAPFIIDGELLLAKLDLLEINLLASLLGCGKFCSKQVYWINYKSNLRDAAEEAKIHFKQAQILEESINDKLKLLVAQKYKSSNVTPLVKLALNAQVLSALVDAELKGHTFSYQHIIEPVKLALHDALIQQQLGNTSIIEISYAMLNYSQLSFDNDLVDLVVQKISCLDNGEHYSQREKNILSKVIVMLNQLSPYLDCEQKIIDLAQKFEELVRTASPAEMKVNILTGTRHQQEKQKEQLLSSYVPHLKIYAFN